MPTIFTCGAEHQRTEFSYRGSVPEGIVIELPSGDVNVSAETLREVLDHFGNHTVPCGPSMTDPPPEGLGAYLEQLGEGLLTPRHASFVCAALQHEGRVRCWLEGQRIMIDFGDTPGQ